MGIINMKNFAEPFINGKQNNAISVALRAIRFSYIMGLGLELLSLLAIAYSMVAGNFHHTYYSNTAIAVR